MNKICSSKPSILITASFGVHFLICLSTCGQRVRHLKQWKRDKVWHKANQISICGANLFKYSWTHHRVIDGLHYSWLVLGKTLTTYPWHIIHICLIFQWPNKKSTSKRRQENAKKCDKNFLISARKKPSRPQKQKFCILKNITRLEIEFGVEWCF